MQPQQRDPLAPATKDPAEGARGKAEGAKPEGSRQEGHLGAGGDPVEGRDDEATSGPAPH